MRMRILLSNTFLVGGGAWPRQSSPHLLSPALSSSFLSSTPLPRIDMDEEGREVREDRDERQTLCAPMVI